MIFYEEAIVSILPSVDMTSNLNFYYFLDPSISLLRLFIVFIHDYNKQFTDVTSYKISPPNCCLAIRYVFKLIVEYSIIDITIITSHPTDSN